MLRNDSLSSDPSDCVVRPPPPKPYKHRRGRNKQRRTSFSSSDDELQTTPDCTSGDEQDIESESVSEKGEHFLSIGKMNYIVHDLLNKLTTMICW